MKSIKLKYRGFLLILLGFAIFSGCGETQSPSSAGIASGRFIDSAVEGLHYLSGNQSGLTDANGTFQIDGTSVQFSIGDIVFGEGIAKSIMTPIDLVPGATDEADPRVINIIRVLLSLDDDGDPSNGIQIRQELREAAVGKSIDFSQTPSSFENDGNVLSIVSELTALTGAGKRSLFPILDAQAHLRNTLLGIKSFSLAVVIAGSDRITVTSFPEGINCGLNCRKIYPAGTSVRLTATVIGAAISVDWSGDPDCADGSVTMTESKTCRATFPLPLGKIASGDFHSCQVLSVGSIQCWGLNNRGQLGDGSTLSSSIPVSVVNVNTATAVSGGSAHTCSLLSNGSIQCWGLNDRGQLGDGSTLSSLTPVGVIGIHTATAISSGGFHTCALLSDNTIQCWGLNLSGRLGNGAFHPSSTPVEVVGIKTAIAVSSGSAHTCALLSGGTVQCWGSRGRLGNGTFFSSSIPVEVDGIKTAIAVSSGGTHTCALLFDGTIRCWGGNSVGQLGNGGVFPWTLIPMSVFDMNTATAITAGALHTCALLSDSTAHCWGEYDKETMQSSLTPERVSDIDAATEIAAGSDHTCAILFDKRFKCWGRNSRGQLGNGKNIGPPGSSPSATFQYGSSSSVSSAFAPVGASQSTGDLGTSIGGF